MSQTATAKPATAEQEAICSSKVRRTKVRAGAGTGKTWTLTEFARCNPNDRILYAAFNKAIQQEALAKFPTNTTSRTVHALGYRVKGVPYANKLGKLQGDIKPFHIQAAIGATLRNIPTAAYNLYGTRVIDTIKAFLVSAEDALDARYVVMGQAPVEAKHFSPRQILQDAQQVWGLMQDINSDVPMLHDGYLKLFQLSKPVLPYSIILADEWQDTNPVTQALLGGQDARTIYVGDTHQAIYGFRGAVNAMDETVSDADFALTGSFRFGPEVAEVANQILEIKPDGGNFRLRGLAGRSQIRPIGQSENYAYISRGNAALVQRATDCLTRGDTFAFVGDIKGYRFDQILDVYNLSSGGNVRDPFLRSFEGFDQLAEYAEMVGDRDIVSRCKLVAKHGAKIPSMLSSIEAKAQQYGVGKPAKVILTTAHKSKGLEFPKVQLANNFIELIDEETGRPKNMSKADIEEVNLLYVSATRAKTTLDVNEGLAEYLEYRAEQGQDYEPLRP